MDPDASAESEETEITVSPEIMELLDRRLAAYEKNPQAVATWEKVQRRAFERRAK